MTPCRKTAFLVALVVLAACGSDDGHSHGDGPAPISTLAYVLSECTEGPGQGFTLEQKLLIRRGEAEPEVLLEIPRYGPIPLRGPCALAGQALGAGLFTSSGTFQRFGMSPHGVLVFELTDDFSPEPDRLQPEEEGFWLVRTDGSGLRRVADASREKCHRVGAGQVNCALAFDPDGSHVTFTDIGPGPDGNTVQIFTMDLATGERHQVTELPVPVGDEQRGRIPTRYPRFVDAETLVFGSYTNPVVDGEELNPLNEHRVFSVKTDFPTSIRVAPFFAEPGNAKQIIDAFQITGAEPVARGIPVPGDPVNKGEIVGPFIYEAFVFDRDNLLQLTNFGRSDTVSARMSADRQRVIFAAAGDPLGTNPFGNCQLFSVDRTGTDMRQLTYFDEGEESEWGCVGAEGPGCWIHIEGLGADAATGSILFTSDCDPFGTSFDSSQVFAVRPDGTGLWQVTRARGMVTHPNGAITVELPGPAAIGTFSGEN